MIHDIDEYPHHESLESQQERIESKDWDWLVVLDACRWDALDDLLDENVEKLRTPTKSSTVGWMKQVWNQPIWSDVTYVSGNPMTDWAQDEDSAEDGYNLNLEFNEYIRAWKGGDSHRYSPKRVSRLAGNSKPPVVAHFMQPHTPFIGDITLGVTDYEWMGETRTSTSEYMLVETGHASQQLIRRAYYKNLEHVWAYARHFINKDGKTVITADHGEALGPEEWSHGGGADPRGRVIPWIEYD
jgi:hypothetical protein